MKETAPRYFTFDTILDYHAENGAPPNKSSPFPYSHFTQYGIIMQTVPLWLEVTRSPHFAFDTILDYHTEDGTPYKWKPCSPYIAFDTILDYHAQKTVPTLPPPKKCSHFPVICI